VGPYSTSMKITVKRVVLAVTLVSGFITGYQILSKPQPVAIRQNRDDVRANAQSFDQKIQVLETARDQSSPPAEVRFTSDEVSAEVAENMAPSSTVPAGTSGNVQPNSPNAPVAQGDVQVKDYQVKLERDVARGQFVANIAGKDVWVTLAGHLNSQDGYVTFDPTEFKVGEFNIPISLVNSALQKKLAEQRDQLKLPTGIASLRVEDGQLVITQK
jgi:hypothetical protein